jgi:SPP1 family predicted phage head-tail adaptor
MDAGKLNKRITIQGIQETRDTDGAIIKGWADVCTVWASIKPLTGREYFDAAKSVDNVVNAKINNRYRAGIKPEMRILYNGVVYEITSIINPNESNQYLLLMCKAGD